MENKMKKRFFSLLLLSMLSPFSAKAEVIIKLDKNVEAIVVDGEERPLTVFNKTSFSLPNGANQLVLRVSKLVTKGSEFEKFRSDPVVVTFDASDTSLYIKPEHDIRFEREAKDYKSKALFVLQTPDGQNLIAEQAVLPRGSGFTRNYEKELARFNKKNQINLYQEDEPVLVEQAPITTPRTKQVTRAQMSGENATILLKADFLRMSQEERKAFLDWASKNTNS